MKIALTRTGDEIAISLRGDINETVGDELQDLLGKIEVPSIVVDTERVELVNSLGTKIWIQFMQSLTKKNIRATFKNCSAAFVESCNISPKFAPPNSIKSLFILCGCSCGSEEYYLIDERHFASDNPVQGIKCKQCGNAVKAAVDPDEYLQCVRGG